MSGSRSNSTTETSKKPWGQQPKRPGAHGQPPARPVRGRRMRERAARKASCSPQRVEKARLRRSFPTGMRRFPLAPAGLPGGKRRKETLLCKASEPTAHVAGFGFIRRGRREACACGHLCEAQSDPEESTETSGGARPGPPRRLRLRTYGPPNLP